MKKVKVSMARIRQLVAEHDGGRHVETKHSKELEGAQMERALENPEWRGRYLSVEKLDLFEIDISLKTKLAEVLTEEEMRRLEPKVEMVRRRAARQVMAMIKGTIKYPGNDDWPLATWLDHLQEEVDDQANYFDLARQKIERMLYFDLAH